MRIRTADAASVGAGFLVGTGQILTCAHVVHWRPSQPDDSGDIAGFELVEDPLSGAQATHLAQNAGAYESSS